MNNKITSLPIPQDLVIRIHDAGDAGESFYAGDAGESFYAGHAYIWKKNEIFPNSSIPGCRSVCMQQLGQVSQ